MRNLVFLVLCLLFIVTVAGFAETSGWIAGFSISSEGFISDQIYDDAEYVGLNLFAEPWTFPFLTPSLSVGAVVPAVPLDFASGLLTAEIGVELFNIRKHPFSGIIDLENSWCPLLSMRALLPFDSLNTEALYWSAVFSPFRLKTGSGRFSVMSAAYITDVGLNYAGWGVRLFDFRLFLF